MERCWIEVREASSGDRNLVNLQHVARIVPINGGENCRFFDADQDVSLETIESYDTIRQAIAARMSPMTQTVKELLPMAFDISAGGREEKPDVLRGNLLGKTSYGMPTPQWAVAKIDELKRERVSRESEPENSDSEEF